MVMLDGPDTNRGRNVCLALAGTADKNDVVVVVEEVAAMKLLHERLVALAAGEVEAVQITVRPSVFLKPSKHLVVVMVHFQRRHIM